MWTVEPTFVTFIIPSLGRPSLEKTIQSLLNLDDWNWRAIIIFDGVDPIKIDCIDYFNDNHFTILKSDERLYNAGLVRNLALPLVNTDWIAFLDDDDFLKETYTSKLKEYSTNNPEKDIIIFTYEDITNGNIQPPPGTKEIEYCKVGISFAIKTEFVNKNEIQFRAGGIEDFAFLDDSRNKGAKYLITNDIQYLVGRRSAWN